jgi:hypothetical protein
MKLENTWKTVSFSRLQVFLTCPLRGELEYIQKLEKPIPWLFAVGQALHYMCFRFFSVSYKNAKTFGSAWKGFWHGVLADEHGPDGFNTNATAIHWNHENQSGYWYHRGAELLEAFYERNIKLRDSGAVRMREKRFRALWRGLILHGVIDRIHEVKKGMIITDYKLGDQNELLLEDALQMFIYAIAYEVLLREKHFDGKPLIGLHFEGLSSGKTQVAPLPSEWDLARLYKILIEYSWYVRGVLTGERPQVDVLPTFDHFRTTDIAKRMFVPNLPRGRHCDICSVVKECREWEKQNSHESSIERWYRLLEKKQRNKTPHQLKLFS